MHRPTMALVLVATVAAGCLGGDEPEAFVPGGPAVAERLAPDVWLDHLSEPVYDAVVSVNHDITAEDGTRLSLTLHLPEGLPADATVPTLMEITPYQSFVAINTDTPVIGVPGPGGSWRDIVLRGAAYVEADARGTTASEGCLDFGGSADRSDARVFADWVRDQAWSNGVVVTDGVSHPGMGSVVAHVADLDLTGALAHAPVVSYYRDEWYQGAKFENQFNGPAYQAVELSPPVYSDPAAVAAQIAACTGQTTLDYSALDGRHQDLWDDRDLSRHVPADIAAPVLLTHGFVDLNVHPDHTQLYWDALPDDHSKALIMGWWYHGWPDLNGHPFGAFSDVRLRWLDTLLLGIDNGLAAEPRVLVEDSQGTWHEGDDWPLEPSTNVTVWAAPGGGASSSPAAEGAASYTDAWNALRGTWQDSHVLFQTEPLVAPRLVNGAPEVHLVASSDQTATKWVAYLLDIAPDGSWQRISHGYADSHTWNGEDAWEDMAPGEAYAWDIMLMPTAVVVDEGHRIGLLVTSQDSAVRTDVMGLLGGSHCWDDHRGGCYDPSGILPAPESIGQATNTIHTGPEGTTVTFDWVDPALTAKPPWSVDGVTAHTS